MLKIVTAAQMREIDRIAIEERGIAGIDLMERAGAAVARETLERFEPDWVVVFAGKGNNGGDGFVAARVLRKAGARVTVVALADPESLRGDALEAWRRLQAQGAGEGAGGDGGDGVEVLVAPAADDIVEIIQARADVVVDAILGTGVSGAVGGYLGEAIEAINAAGVPVLAVDVPSGLPGDPGARGASISAAAGDANSNSAPGPVIRAAVTVTIGLPKTGLVMEPGRTLAGIVTVADIGFPRDLLDSPEITVAVPGMGDARIWLPARPADGHKGTFGRTLIVGGSEGMTGAPALAARAAARSGAGLVFAAHPRALGAAFEALLIEPIKLAAPGPGDQARASWFGGEADEEFILTEAAKVDAVALGPGLGRREETRAFVRRLVREIKAPMVIDADALNLLAGGSGDDGDDGGGAGADHGPGASLRGRPGPTILTPHPAEAARLLGSTVEAVQADRLGACLAAARDWNAVMVLKGAGTVVTSPDGMRTINPTGNTGLAKGGSGDVLTGLIAGLLAQGAPAADAARLGVFLHGVAADMAARKRGVRAMLPTDVIEALGEAFMAVERGE